MPRRRTMATNKLLGLLPLLLLPALAHAQSALDVNVNFGSAWDSATGLGIDVTPVFACVRAKCSRLPVQQHQN